MAFNILIVEDEEELREIIGFCCEIEFPGSTIKFGKNGLEGLNLLKAEKDFQLIISDFKMPVMTGAELIREVKNDLALAKIPFVFCSAFSEELHMDERNQADYWVNKPLIADGIKDFAAKFKLRTEQNQDSYLPISLDFLNFTRQMPCPIFARLSEDKFVKIFEKDDIFDLADRDKYKLKKVSHFYVSKENKDKIIAILDQFLKGQQFATKNEGCAYTSLSQVVLDCLKLYQFSPNTIEYANKFVEASISHIEAIKDLRPCIEKILKDPNSYLAKHVSLLTLFSFEMVMAMDWKNNLTFQKLATAALLHDFDLDESLTDDLNQEEAEKLSRRLKESYLEHPIATAERIRNIKAIPPDIDRIILEHHELPDGNGFPRKLSALQMSPLSAVFICAHMAATQVLARELPGTPKTKEEIIAVIENKLQSKGPFKKIMEAFKAKE